MKTAKIEKEIIFEIVKNALDLGYLVDHHNGDDVTVRAYPDVRRAISFKQLMREIRQCDEESIIIRDKDKNYIGSIFLVYGNDGFDVICDHTANDEMEKILAPANALADSYQ